MAHVTPSSRPRRSPSYRRHKPSGQAVVTLSGRDHYLGPYGSQASRDRYERLLGEWLASGRRLPQPRSDRASLTVEGLIAAYWPHVEQHYRRPDGSATSEVDLVRLALRPVRRLYATTPAQDFGPLALKTVRDDYIARDMARKTVNDHTARVRQMFRWGVAQELVAAHVYQGLRAVTGLKRGRSSARETEPVRPVPEADLKATLACLPHHVAAMTRLLDLTGMRIGELIVLRTGDIDRSGNVWEYQPEQHKTVHHGHQRRVYFGERAQAVLRPFLKADPKAFIFSPREAEAERRARQREARVTPLTPSQRARRPTHRPKRAPGDQYSVAAVRRAIARACEDAGVSHWHTHQLRHNAATRLRREGGIDAARVILGHRTLTVTDVYAEIDSAKARELVARVG